MKKRKIIALVFIISAAAALYQGSGLLLFAFSPSQPGADEKIYVQIKRGQSGAQVAAMLKEKGIVSSQRRFVWIGQILRQWKNMKAGEYALTASMTPIAVFSVITSGISVSHPITIREGQNIFQIGDLLGQAGLAQKGDFVRLVKSPEFIASLGFLGKLPPSLEGYLFPETYHFNRSQTLKEMIVIMHDRFLKEWTTGRKERAKKTGMTRHEVITLASIIEKETGAPHERPLISSVFHNRIKKKMRLASDPTTIYGIWETFNGNLRRHHLKQRNDYNTYAKRGLPIGPIANPGSEAIEAALYPDTSTFLYFVSKNDGTHQFSETLQQHNAAVRRYQLNRKARQGKSWRDLKKKKKRKSASH